MRHHHSCTSILKYGNPKPTGKGRKDKHKSTYLISDRNTPMHSHLLQQKNNFLPFKLTYKFSL